MSDPPADGALPEVNLLVVDDERLNRDLLERMLRRVGYRVFLAETAGQAFEVLRTQRIDAMLLDLLMPDANGLAVLDALGILGHLPRLRVIVLTGLEDEHTKNEAFRRGAAGFLSKPILRADLYEAIRRALEGAPAQLPRRATEGGDT